MSKGTFIHMKRMRNLKGFTLIELIVVILILGILAAIAVVGYTNITTRANETAALANAKQIVSSLSADATLATQNVDVYVAALDAGNEALDQAKLVAKFPGVKGLVYNESAKTITVGDIKVPVVINLDGPVAQILPTP